MVLDQFSVLDDAAPGARLAPEHLDERREAMQVGSRRALDVARTARVLLEQAPGSDVEAEHHPGQSRSELAECHHAAVVDSLLGPPLDPVVGPLRFDLGGELLRLAPDFHREGNLAGILLRDARDPVHELRPLVVDGLHRQGDVDALLDRHPASLPDTLCVLLTASAAGQRALDRALEDPAAAPGLRNLLLHPALDRLAKLGCRPLSQLLRPAAETVPSAALDQLADSLHRNRRDGGGTGAGGQTAYARERLLWPRTRSVSAEPIGRPPRTHALQRFADRGSRQCARRVVSHPGTSLPSFGRFCRATPRWGAETRLPGLIRVSGCMPG